MKMRVWNKVINILPSQKARCLFLAGIMFVMIGWSNIATADELNPRLPAYQAYEAQFMLVKGLEFWGFLFAVAGIVAIAGAFIDRYPLGFFSLMFMSSWWSGLFAVSLLYTGYSRIIPSIFVWALISVFLYTISSWPEAVEEAKRL